MSNVNRKVAIGDPTPNFDLQTDTGDRLSLASLRGKVVILYFYPKDATPGCTAEACEFRDLLPRFEAGGAVVLGISPDSVRSHAKFKAKHGLPYTLLSDPDHAVCEAFDVWHEKLFWGRRYMGVVRSTFVIGPDGRLQHAWRDVNPEGHAAEVAAWLRA